MKKKTLMAKMEVNRTCLTRVSFIFVLVSVKAHTTRSNLIAINYCYSILIFPFYSVIRSFYLNKSRYTVNCFMNTVTTCSVNPAKNNWDPVCSDKQGPLYFEGMYILIIDCQDNPIDCWSVAIAKMYAQISGEYRTKVQPVSWWV